ncbi:MAG: hypothetical protein K2O32_05785 [Acetatifactor sp.]|nr:hypothetical protein [Acetatifactor sp.]
MIYKILFCLGSACIVFLPILAAWMWTRMKIAKYERSVLSDMQLEECEEEDEYGEDDEFITEPYFMRLSPLYCIIGIVGAIFFYGLAVMVVFLPDWDDSSAVFAVILFIVFALLEDYLCVVTLLWTIKVDTDALTLYRFPLRPKVFYFYEITKVRYLEKFINDYSVSKRRLIAYHDQKKLFEVDDDMSHFAFLLQRLEAEKGLERGFLKADGVELNAYQDIFSITKTKADKIRAMCGALFFIGLFVTCFFAWGELKEDPYYLLYYIGFFLASVIGTWNFASVMAQKVTVTYQDIYVRDAKSVMASLFTLGASDMERCYSIRNITRVENKEYFIYLYVGEKRIAKICKLDKNYALFDQRLQRTRKEV